MFRAGHTPSWHESCSVLKAQHALKNLLFEQQEAKYDFSSRTHWHKMAIGPPAKETAKLERNFTSCADHDLAGCETCATLK